jgi:Smg protein
MKENVFDVLVFLFDNYLEDEYRVNEDEETLKNKLLQAGFGNSEVNKAFDWLEGLTTAAGEVGRGKEASAGGVHRIFNDQEMGRLDTECRGFLASLEQAGVLDMHDREMVIDRVMALESDDVDLYQLKWVVLMVLLNQPGKEHAFTRMEGIVMDRTETGLH